jgi:uncharacterized protein (DUF362 family)
VEDKVKFQGRVVVVRDPGLVRGGEVNIDKTFWVISRSILSLTGAESEQGGWRSLFKKEDRVGIKVNTLSGARLSTHPGVVQAIVKGLMMAGVKAENILIWDRMTDELKRAGFAISKGGGVRCFGTDMVGYEPRPESAGSVGSCFSRILTEFCTAIVNVPVLKDHDLAGVTLGMKNFYGAIHNPNKYHDNGCSPYVADLNAHPLIKDRLRLIVCDGLIALCNGGPAYKGKWAWDYRGLLISLDPVALDRIGAQIIERRRREIGLPSLAEEGREPKYIDEAGRLGLGVSDPGRIEVISI